MPASLCACTTASGKKLLFFAAWGQTTGVELFAYDGTGVSLVKDINPGSAHGGPSDLVSWNGRVYFAADDGLSGRELWVSDGTTAGTVLLKDIYSGPASSRAAKLAACSDRVYFFATDGTSGLELWGTTGTTAGTVLVKDIRPGAGNASISWLTPVANRLYFTADDGTHGTELWVSDGSAAGTKIVADIAPGAASSSPFSLATCAGTVFFSADHPSNGRRLFKVVDAGPVVETIADGCDGIELRATPAAIGGSFRLSGYCAPAGTIHREPPHDGHIGLTYLMLSTRPGFVFHNPALLAPRCWAWSFGLAEVMLVDMVSLTEQWQSDPKPIPNLAGLKGVQLHFQSLYVDLRTTVPLKTSNVVQLTIG